MPINSVNIVGNLTRDPELRALPSGGNVCSLRVAVNERRKNQAGEWEDAPNFFNVTVFGNNADNAAKFLAKGRQVAVSGRLRWREFTDKDQNRREAIEIVANDVQFIGGRDEQTSGLPEPTSTGWAGGGGGGWTGGGAAQKQAPAPAAQAPAAAPPADDDLPF